MEKKKDLSHIDWDKLIKATEALYAPENNTTHCNGYDFVCTCHACPEQYDVYKGDYKNGNRVAYVRKRWGHLVVHPVKNYEINWHFIIYEESDSDAYNGMIDNKNETFEKITNILNSYGTKY